MRNTTLIIAGLICLYIPLHAQEQSHGWQEKPVIHQLPAEFAKESAVIIELNTLIKYEDGDDNQLWMYRTSHRIIKVLDEKGVENFNKMTVPLYPGESTQTIKARTILPDGTVKEIAQDKMKEMKGENGGTEIVFAMEGVEKNAEVELQVTYKKQPVFFGKETFQYLIPVVEGTFELTAPSRLKFEEKGYNGFPTVSDTLIDNTRHIFAKKGSITALEKEEYSFEDASRMKAEYKLSYLPEKNAQVRTFTWQELVEKLYANTYKISDKEQKAVENYVNSIGIREGESEEEKIQKIESAIKSGITINKDIDPEKAGRMDYVIANKATSENGMVRLFASCFTAAGVKNEFGMTTNHNDNLFDAGFENWNELDEYLFYFPGTKKFLSPTEIYFRYPFTSLNVLGNKGVFCKMTTIGDITNAISDIRTIAPRPVTESRSDVRATVTFDQDMEPTADVTYSYTGYCAMGLREVALLLPKDKLKDLVSNIISMAVKPENMIKYGIAGEAFENYYTAKPLEFSATIKASQLVEKAGPKYIFRLGDLIGRQSELYQKSERKLPVDMPYSHSLNRTLTVSIPDGYTVVNPEVIKMKTEIKEESGTVTTGFASDYKLEGNQLIVNITEFYSQLHFPVSDYEPFRKVINASADFNKVSIILTKK